MAQAQAFDQTSDVVLLEKEPFYGGTTARSGGVLWVPNNPISTLRPEPDSLDAARTYLRHECGAAYDLERVEAFLAHGPRMVEFFTRPTDVQLVPLPDYADYHYFNVTRSLRSAFRHGWRSRPSACASPCGWNRRRRS